MASRYTLHLDNGVVIALDATTKVVEKFSGTATENPTANRTSVTDHYIRKNAQFTIDGVISGVYNPKDSVLVSSEQLTENLRSLILQAKLISFQSGDKLYESCFVEDLSLSKTVKEGVNGWMVSLHLKQINIATGGEETTVNVLGGQSDPKTNVSASSTKDKGIPQLEGLGDFTPDTQFGKKNYSYKG
jgi:hypothetical protein